MFCPNCNHSLTPLKITTEAGGKIEVDHCYFCGGVWFDRFELNRLPLKEAFSLSRMATKEEIKRAKGSNLCPRDKKPLKEFVGQNIPPGTTVMSCTGCGGSFVNQSDLFTLKKAQKLKIDFFKAWKIPMPALSTVLLPVLLLFAVSFGTFLTVRTVREKQELRIKAKEMIGTPTIIVSPNNSVFISFSTSVPAFSLIVYQVSDEKEPVTVPVATEKTRQHSVTLYNLKAKTTYNFKIYVEEIPGQILSSTNYSFTTN